MLKRTIFLVLILVAGGVTAVTAQETNRAALVVLLADGEAVTRCVEFDEAEVTGLELLNRSGLEIVTAAEAMGPAVCSVADTGCPANDCFCQCKGGDCVYWSYWHLREGEWRYSQAGASIFQVSDGMVEGWTFGPGTPQDALEPPLLTFDEVCAAPAVELTVVATAVPQPTIDQPAEPEAANQTSWLGYGLLGLIVVGVGGLLAARGRKTQ
jgi:hypothetical protein